MQVRYLVAAIFVFSCLFNSVRFAFSENEGLRKVTLSQKKELVPARKEEESKRNKVFFMGMGSLRLNWTQTKGDDIRFRYSDMGLPEGFETRERASFVANGTFWDDYTLDGYLDYDPENRVMEPDLQFLVHITKEQAYLWAGDYEDGVFKETIFPRYDHPFRGGIVGADTERFGFEVLGGQARGESMTEEFPVDAGAGPYYLSQSPLIRGSETVYVIVRSQANPGLILRQYPLSRNKDYYIDYDRGEIMLNVPLNPDDGRGNPVFLRVSYQYESIEGSFTRNLFGVRSYVRPVKPLTLEFTYIADADKDLDFGDAIDQRRGIGSFGAQVNTERVNIYGEYAFNDEKDVKHQDGFFTGGNVKITDRVHLAFDAWSVDTEFPTFANDQLAFGFDPGEVIPEFRERSICLSPFQFARDLGGELYPLLTTRISNGEHEGNAFIEREGDETRLSGGYGYRKGIEDDVRSHLAYVSVFHDGERTKYWGKGEFDKSADPSGEIRDDSMEQVLAGVRHRALTSRHGDLYLQGEYKLENLNDHMEGNPSTLRHIGTVLAEFLTDDEGYYAGYTKEILDAKNGGGNLLDSDIFETGIRKHVYKSLFIDSRYRYERNDQEEETSHVHLVSLGAGVESKYLNVMARYEFQINKSDAPNKDKRQLWSVFIHGTPLKNLHLSLRYYKRKNNHRIPAPSSESSEEELNFRLLWHMTRKLSIYSQWMYGTNVELDPPVDRTSSDTIEAVQGLKYAFAERWEFLANYKLIKVWGPLDDKKESATAEVDYLVHKHVKLGVGVEQVWYRDNEEKDNNYDATVGYIRLIAFF